MSPEEAAEPGAVVREPSLLKASSAPWGTSAPALLPSVVSAACAAGGAKPHFLSLSSSPDIGASVKEKFLESHVWPLLQGGIHCIGTQFSHTTP